MKPVHSTNSMSTYQRIMNRRSSIAEALKRTAEGLANEFNREKTAEEMVFELFKIPNKNYGAIGKLIGILKSYGIQENDPRLRPMMNKICQIEKQSEEMAKEAKDPKHWKLSREDFISCVSESLPLISRTIQNQLTVPSWTHFCSVIEEIFKICESNNDGHVATYIPQLARADPETWAVSICTVDGQRISFGDFQQPFCIQSISKAFNYALAASELGADYVHKFVGQEPSGRLYNEICLDSKNIPHNPLISTGAIVVASLMKPNLCIADRFDHFLNTYRRISGGDYIGFNNAVFLSERMASDRNFALAYYLNEYKCFPPSMKSLPDLMDFYLQLMSLETNCESAAVMAATLANGGVCPITDERVIESRPCRDVLSLMYSCGLYDYSGQFAFHVGLPAKSSASGSMIVVVPNLMGICLYSPALDELGNTCRGVEFCKEMITRFSLHNYDSLAHTEQHKFDPRKRVGEQERDQVISLLFAARTGDMNILRRLFMQRVDMSSSDYDKRTALHVAAAEGQLEVVKFLVNIARVKIDAKDRWGRTPMDDAIHFQHSQIVTVLEKAAEITVATNDIAIESNLPQIQSDGKLPADISIPASESSSEDEFEIEIPDGGQRVATDSERTLNQKTGSSSSRTSKEEQEETQEERDERVKFTLGDNRN